jgi:hypothetical protein
MPIIDVSQEAYEYLTAHDEAPSWVLDNELRESFEKDRVMREIRDALGLDFAEIPDFGGPPMSAARIEAQGVLEAIERLRDLASIRRDSPPSEYRPCPPDPWEYDTAERDAIEHAPMSRWTIIRHPQR